MKMVAEALSKNTKIKHRLKDEELPATHVSVPKDGKSLRIDTTISAENGLTGQYLLTITLSKAEVQMLTESLIKGPLRAEIQELKSKLAKEKLLKSTPL